MNKWLLDPDMMEKDHQPVSSNFVTIVKTIVEKKFENEKYIEEVGSLITNRKLLKKLSLS